MKSLPDFAGQPAQFLSRSRAGDLPLSPAAMYPHGVGNEHVTQLSWFSAISR
jgi:hypothetical protein